MSISQLRVHKSTTESLTETPVWQEIYSQEDPTVGSCVALGATTGPALVGIGVGPLETEPEVDNAPRVDTDIKHVTAGQIYTLRGNGKGDLDGLGSTDNHSRGDGGGVDGRGHIFGRYRGGEVDGDGGHGDGVDGCHRHGRCLGDDGRSRGSETLAGAGVADGARASACVRGNGSRDLRRLSPEDVVQRLRDGDEAGLSLETRQSLPSSWRMRMRTRDSTAVAVTSTRLVPVTPKYTVGVTVSVCVSVAVTVLHAKCGSANSLR